MIDKITIDIDCNNDAIASSVGHGVAEMLRELADRLEEAEADGTLESLGRAKMWDINGNMVGTCTVETDDE